MEQSRADETGQPSVAGGAQREKGHDRSIGDADATIEEVLVSQSERYTPLDRTFHVCQLFSILNPSSHID